MNIKTITSTDGVNEVDFGSSASRFYWFRNIGTTAVHVSGKADIVAGADGVAELAAGDSVCIETLGGKVYVLGEGKVEIHNTGDKFPPFRNAPVSTGGGGEAVDAYTKSESDARYPLITDVVPYKMGMDFGTCTTAAETIQKTVTTLNKIAPTVGAVFAIKFTNAVPAQARLSVNGVSGYIQYRCSSIPAGIINAGDVVAFMYYQNTGFNRFEIISIENGVSATPIKSTQLSGTTSTTGNVQLWATTDKKIPISAMMNDRYGYIFSSSNGYYYVGVAHPDEHTFQVSEVVSGTVYYIEKNTINVG